MFGVTGAVLFVVQQLCGYLASAFIKWFPFLAHSIASRAAWSRGMNPTALARLYTEEPRS